jgi:hypothetical protein
VQFPDPKVVLGRYLGPTEPEIGSVIIKKILTMSGEILRLNTIQHLTDEEKNSEENRKERDETVGRSCGVPFEETDLGPSLGVSVTTPEYEVSDDDETKAISSPEIDDVVGTSEYDPEGYNHYITSEVSLPKGDEYKVGKVIQSKVDKDG